MQTNKEWISISDMMAGLMMVFLFIAIAFMLNAEEEKKAIEEIALTYEEGKKSLNKDLHEEFDEDIIRWGGEILSDNTIRFKEPEVLFSRNSSNIKEKFKEILDDFFPRYIAILFNEKYKEDIDEVRIEGHTSSIWRLDSSPEVAYLENAKLSQDRSLSVLNYVYLLESMEDKREWLSGVLRANGLSYAKRIYKDGQEDFTRSRRVEFRVLTKAEEKIYTILNRAKRS